MPSRAASTEATRSPWWLSRSVSATGCDTRSVCMTCRTFSSSSACLQARAPLTIQLGTRHAAEAVASAPAYHAAAGPSSNQATPTRAPEGHGLTSAIRAYLHAGLACGSMSTRHIPRMGLCMNLRMQSASRITVRQYTKKNVGHDRR
jgi:hypothetical protein